MVSCTIVCSCPYFPCTQVLLLLSQQEIMLQTLVPIHRLVFLRLGYLCLFYGGVLGRELSLGDIRIGHLVTAPWDVNLYVDRLWSSDFIQIKNKLE